MTVQKLIEELQKMPEDYIVINFEHYEMGPSEKVEAFYVQKFDKDKEVCIGYT